MAPSRTPRLLAWILAAALLGAATGAAPLLAPRAASDPPAVAAARPPDPAPPEARIARAQRFWAPPGSEAMPPPLRLRPRRWRPEARLAEVSR